MDLHKDDLLGNWQRAQDNLVLQYNDLALSTLANMVSSSTIEVSPRFQRRDRWTPAKQAALIESFMINLPIPPIYLTEEAGGRYAVIDGRQRLTAIRLFFEDELVLQHLDELPELNGLRFSELPHEIRNNLGMRPLRSVTLMRQTDSELKYLVFHRLNSAGDILNAQEIRNVVYRGPLNDALHTLSENPFLRKQLKIDSEESSAYRKMQDVEFVLRFLTLTESWNKFSGDFAPSMDEYMARHQRATEQEVSDLAEKFERAIQACEKIWGDHAFHRPDGSGWRSQSLAGLYDAEMIAVDRLSDSELTRVISRTDRVIRATRALFDQRDFDTAVRTGTNTPARVRFRIEWMTNTLKDIAGR